MDISLQADSTRSPQSVSQSAQSAKQLAPSCCAHTQICLTSSLFFHPHFPYSQVPSHSWGRTEYKLYQKESGHLRTSPSPFLTICSVCILISPPPSLTAFDSQKLFGVGCQAVMAERDQCFKNVFHVCEFMCV